jgi:poly [ADP-ribose] polymerase
MPHLLEEAKSGRSVCRSCKENIPKGAMRFGEEVPNAFDPDGGTTHQWHHLMCAAQKKPHQLRDALAVFAGPLPDRDAVDAAVAEALLTAKPPLPFVEHAPSGRSRCQVCREAIEKGELRLAVARPAGSMPQESAAYLHPQCARKHTQDADLFPTLQKHSRGLTPEDWASVENHLR